MMSNTCRYALRAVLELSLREEVAPMTIAAIAEAQDIPARFLEAIMRELKVGGIVVSVRGKDGGYRLALPAAAIRVGDVVRLFGGAGRELGAPAADTGDDVFADVWTNAARALSRVLDSVSFAQMAEKARRRREGDALHYVI